MEGQTLNLWPWEEYLGIVEGFEVKNNDVLIIFEGSTLLLAKEETDLEFLRNHVGKKIGILRTDIADKPFLFRVIGKKNKIRGNFQGCSCHG